MKYSVTSTIEKTHDLFTDDDYRIIVEQGGTSAGKTIAILWELLEWAVTNEGKVISIVSDTFPNLKKGAMRDFLDICRETGIINIATWNKTESTLYLPNGTIIEFFSVDTMGAHGARRDILYVNEANRISWETFSQLEVRTRYKVIIDFNPVNEFWAHTELINNKERNDVAFLKVNYADNEALDEATVKAIEQRRGDGTSNWWRVYGLGEIGSLEGNVYEGWIRENSEIPNLAKLVRYGVDFGFSNDPTAVIAVYEDDEKGIWLKQELCETKLLTPQLIEKLKAIIERDGDALFVCDNARPEIIAEIKANGIRAIGCDKTPGEKMNGKRYNIELVQRRKVHYLASDKELEREYLTYAWRKKKTGEILDEPVDGNDHCMDAIAYAIRDLKRKKFDF